MPHRQTPWVSALILAAFAFAMASPRMAFSQEDEDLIDSMPAAKKKKKKKTRPKPVKREESTSSEAPRSSPSSEAARALAFKNIGIAEFESARSGGPGADYSMRLAEALRLELKRQGAVNPIDIPRVYSLRIPRTRLQQESQDAVAEGLLVGEISTKEVQAALLSVHGRRVLGIKLSLKPDEEPRSLAQRLAEALSKQFTYRGYITSVEGDTVHLNIGSRQKLENGERLSVFDFENFNEGLASAKVQVGQVEITEVQGADASRARIISGASDIKLFQKIELSSSTSSDRPVAERTPSRPEPTEPSIPNNWQMVLGAHTFTAGAEQETSASSANAYQIRNTIFGYLGMRTARGFEAHLLFGSSKADPYPVSVYELRTGYEFLNSTRGAIRWTGLFGARFASYTTGTSASGAMTSARSSTIYSLMARPRANFKLGSKLDGYLGMEFYFPLLSNLSSSMFSYGAGPEIGARSQLTRSWAIEGGAFLRYYRRAVDGSDSVFERDLQFFGNILIGF